MADIADRVGLWKNSVNIVHAADAPTAAMMTMLIMSNIVSRLFNSSSDELYWKLQLISSILVGVTFVIGFWTVRVGWRAHRRQSREMGEFSKKTEELRTANIAGQKELETEKVKRLEMEKSLAPRILPMIYRQDGTTNFDALKPKAGTNVVIRLLPEAEPMRAVNDLSQLLQAAGWNVGPATISQEYWMPFWDGVVVEPHSVRPTQSNADSWRDDMAKENLSRESADILVEFLERNNWPARRHAGTNEIPPGSVRVTVGFKKLPYFEQSPPPRGGLYMQGNVGLKSPMGTPSPNPKDSPKTSP